MFKRLRIYVVACHIIYNIHFLLIQDFGNPTFVMPRGKVRICRGERKNL